MPSPYKLSVTIVVVWVLPTHVMAWDPYTVAAGARAASGIIGGMSGGGAAGGLEDLAEVGLALGDLLVELEVDPTADKEAEESVRKLDSIRKTVNETVWTKQEMEHLLDFEQLKAKSHAQRIQHVRKMVQMTKKIGTLFGIRPKAAEKANQVQQTQINYLVLEELMAARRARFQSFLEDQDQKVQRQVFLERMSNEEKAQRENLWTAYRARRKP